MEAQFPGFGALLSFFAPLCFFYGRNSFSTCNLIGDHFPDNEHFSVWYTVLPCPCLWVSQTLLKEERSLEFPIPRSEDSGAEVVIISGSLEDAPWILGCKTCRLLPWILWVRRLTRLPSPIPSVWDGWWFSLKPFSVSSSPLGRLLRISKSPSFQLWLFMSKWLSYSKREQLMFYFSKY